MGIFGAERVTGIIPGISKHLFQLFVGQLIDLVYKFAIGRLLAMSNVGGHINNISSWHLFLLTKFRRPPSK